MSGDSDGDLVQAAASDARAFRALYDRWAAPLLAWLYRQTFDAEASADITAETFAIAWRKRAHFDPSRSAASSWLFGIAARELRRWQRRRRTELRALARLGASRPPLGADDVARIEALADISLIRDQIRHALEGLPERQRAAVSLRVLDDLDYPTVAAQLGCSEQAARVNVHRGLKRLATAMEEPS